MDYNLVKKLIPQNILESIPQYAEKNISEILYYIMILRTYDNARRFYIPSNNIKTKVNFFKAEDSVKIDSSQWNFYCEKSVETYIIKGDHYSIFKKPDVIGFSEIFNRDLTLRVLNRDN